jgi:hypothetical protein
MRRKKVKRKPSERTLFERWFVRKELGFTAYELRGYRSEFGYNHGDLDWCYMGWLGRAQQGQPGEEHGNR